ncbi:hypothetical protein [Chamaesiphon sp. VAR_48_metabat_135_sub]|nr:hypothetical protein [Chamaesiphon sp. VAR_48_metabat_135_sub]
MIHIIIEGSDRGDRLAYLTESKTLIANSTYFAKFDVLLSDR